MSKLSLHRILNGTSRYLSKNSSSILTGCGIAGIVVTAITAVYATMEASEKINDAEEVKQEPLTNKEVVKVAWKSYIPVAIAGVSSAACFVGAQTINMRRNMALATLYSMTANNFSDYREAVVKKLGEKKEEEVRDEVSRKQLEKNPVSSSEVLIGDGDTLCYDSWSGRYFKSSIEKIRGAVNTINHDLNSELTIPLNDFYFLLNLSSTVGGDETGWNIDNPMKVYFSSQIAENNEPCIVINYYTKPMEDYLRL